LSVLHALAGAGDLSGPARSLLESVAALRAAGEDASAFIATSCPAEGSPLVCRLRERGIPFRWRRAGSAASPGAIADLARALVSTRRNSGNTEPAVLHTHGERALLWGVAAAPLARAAHVHTLHGLWDDDPRGGRVRDATRRLLRGTSALVAPDAMAAATLADPATVRVVPNCLDPAPVRAAAAASARETIRRRLALAESDRAYLFLGRLSPSKGADLLGLLLKELQAASGAARLVVAGRGPLAAGVEAMADIRFLGQRDDPEAVLAAADVVLMPSRQEGVPMVALEAAALSVPVAAFAVGGLAGSGLAETVPPLDTGALAATALRLVREPAARKVALLQSAAALSSRFAPPGHAAALLAVYRSLTDV
jgi:glycosyltransferase involved in cell wall biosynthesis